MENSKHEWVDVSPIRNELVVANHLKNSQNWIISSSRDEHKKHWNHQLAYFGDYWMDNHLIQPYKIFET